MKPWEKYQAQSTSPKPWEKYTQSVTPVEQAPGSLEAIARGGEQGLTGGFSDELGGVGNVLGSALYDTIHGSTATNLDNMGEIYRKGRDEQRAANQAAQDAHPVLYTGANIAGSVPGAIALGGESLAGQVGSGALQSGVNSLGSSNADLTQGQFGQAAKDTALGTAFGGVTGAAGYGASKLLPKISGYLGDKAAKLAENATGATRVQAEKFSDNAGRELLDRGLVKFGDTPENIANRTGEVLKESRGKISGSLKTLDEQGGQVSKKEILENLQAKINELSSDPSQAAVKRKLEQNMADIQAVPGDSVSLSAAEKTKRGFQDLANYNDPSAHAADKTVASIYQKAVENNSLDLNPELAGTFTQGKKDFGLIAPINEAAQKRATQLNQHPWGGLLDLGALGAGTVAGNREGHTGGGFATGLGLIALRRGIAPRIGSSSAVVTDNLAKMFGSKFAQKGIEAGTRATGASLFPMMSERYKQTAQDLSTTTDPAASHYLLSQRDPSYRLNE